MIVVIKEPKLSINSRLIAKYYSVKQIMTPNLGIFFFYSINSRQNGRRIKSNNEEMFTLTVQDRHGIIVEENLGGSFRSSSSVVLANGISPTLMTMGSGGHEPKIIENNLNHYDCIYK